MNASVLMAVFLAICAVESNDNTSAYNAREDAAGPAQIRLICLQDVNSWGYNYTPQDRFDRRKSFEIFCLYVTHYGATTPEQAARIWNAGKRGYELGRGKEYWKKIKKILDNKR